MAGLSAARPIVERLSIGQVLDALNGEFTDLTLSKLRFIEERGLVTPERTSKGYRKFTQSHIERIRLILTLQRDHYLPLKVISEFLDDLDEGKNPEIPGKGGATHATILTPSSVLTRAELLKQTGCTTALLGEAIASGIIAAVEVYPREAVAEVTAIMQLAQRGITPRHLRAMRVAAERDVELLKQASSTRGQHLGTPASREQLLELADALDTVRSGIVRSRLIA